jgi:hypothetical protein
MSRKFLYSRLGWAVIAIVILAFVAATAVPSLAQRQRRQNTPPEEKPPDAKKAKKEKEPRAVGVVQLSSSGKGTLIPVAILIDGKFHDASVYKADPIPMALESGTVYEVEQAGDSQGFFTVSGALHSKNPGSPNPWVGAGSYLPHGTEVAKTTHKAENVPVGMDNSDEPPRLARKDSSKAAPAPAASSTTAAPASTAPAGSGSSGKSGPAAAPSTAPPATGSPAGTSSGRDAQKPATPAASGKPADQGATDQPARPAAQASPSQGSPGQTSSGQASSAQNSAGQNSAGQPSAGKPSEDYYRPTLRRGKPTQAAPQEDEAVTKAGKTEAAATPTATAAVSSAPPQLVAAISDSAGPDPKSYKFFWKTGEEEERRNQMLAAAGDEVRAYVAALARDHISATPPAAKTNGASRKTPAKQAQPVFENLQFHTFDLWGNNQPVMILSAEAHFPPAPGAATAPDSYSITLVAKTDIYGNLRKLYSGVTDKFHLDVTPRMQLIDAVDVDGDGRGELLFHETTDAGNGYVIYRATADKLWKVFDNLNAE